MHARADERSHALLRLRRDLLDPAARTIARIAQAQDRGPDRKRPGDDRNGEHRLPRTPARSKPGSRPALDRDRRGFDRTLAHLIERPAPGTLEGSSAHQLTHLVPGA